jgi:methionyl-tRNA formyltransferase
MNITILTDNPKSWIIPYIEILKKELIEHNVIHIFDKSEIIKGDIMFILSCESLLKSKDLALHRSNIVVHPSKLPHGKGWSPLAWQILENSNKIPVSLFEAVESVDSGEVYLLDYILLEGHELNEEIKKKQGELTIKMVLKYINEFNTIKGIPQFGDESFYKKRTIADNELDPNKSIADNFNLLRIVDNERYPAFFYMNKKKYIIKIYKDEANL